MQVRTPSNPKPESRFVRKSSKEAVEANRQEQNSEAPPQNLPLQKNEFKDEALPQKLPSLDDEALQQKSLSLPQKSSSDDEALRQKSPSLPQKSPSTKSQRKPVLNAMNKKYVEAKQQELLQLLAQQDVGWSVLEHRFAGCKHALNPNTTDSEAKITTLHRAAFDGVAGCVRWCIEAGADVCASTTAGRAPLHYACEGNSPDCVELLIRQEADPNQSTLGGATPLHIACINNCSDAVTALLYTALDVDIAIDIEVEDARRQTPEMLAKKNPVLLEIISKYLIDAEAKRKQRIAMAAAMALSASLSEGQLCAVFGAWAKEAQEAKKRIRTCSQFEGGERDEHPSALAEDEALEHPDEEALPAADEASEENQAAKSSEGNQRKKFVPAYALALGLG